ncbi:MAG: MCE family protein [Frankiaceae bacterium]|nr:MCE family protein [Frankiaceae bacterium]MBV9871873.1 MCE family protein [Frankiaceae bacterium]
MSGPGRHPYRTYGVVALVVIGGLVALCLVAFAQLLTPKADVTVQVERAGQQLLPGSDVKLRGINVGTVSSITSDGTGAELHLHMKPSMLKDIPDNVLARIIPKTLFGEKYVDLVLPAQPSSSRLHDGSVITIDRTTSALEIDKALNDLLPVLQAVRPQKLNSTLNAIATALHGRGNELGATVEHLDAYLKGLNPHLSQLKHDVTALASVSHTYNQAADSLLRMLDNLVVTSNTVVDQQAQIERLLADVTTASLTTRDLLKQNATNIVQVNAVNRDVVALLARYSPEFPCFFRGDAGLAPRIHDAVPTGPPGLNHAAHVVVEFVPAFPTYKYPIDLPEFGDTRGPNCYGLPHPKLRLPVIRYKDGTQDDPRFAAQGQPGPVGSTSATKGQSARGSASMGDAGTKKERSILNQLLGPILGLSSTKVPDIADLLWGPLARGNGVNLK